MTPTDKYTEPKDKLCNYKPHTIECSRFGDYKVVETDTGKEFYVCSEHIQGYHDLNERYGREYFVIIKLPTTTPTDKYTERAREFNLNCERTKTLTDAGVVEGKIAEIEALAKEHCGWCAKGRTAEVVEYHWAHDGGLHSCYAQPEQRRLAELRAELRQQVAAAESHHHGEPCYYCGEPIDSVAADPSRWGIPLCHEDDPGTVKAHHIGCVSERLQRITTARELIDRLNQSISIYDVLVEPREQLLDLQKEADQFLKETDDSESRAETDSSKT